MSAAGTRSFDYDAEAEFFCCSRGKFKGRTPAYRRFPRAMDAIAFAVEELPPASFAGASIEVAEVRYRGDEIRRLHADAAYAVAQARPAARG